MTGQGRSRKDNLSAKLSCTKRIPGEPMANTKTTTGKAHANGTPKAKKAEEARTGAYFLSLSLENVRCFGPKQTLDLSDGNGKPARWTILLGLNGTGKTTVLQSLAFEREEEHIPRIDRETFN